MELGNIVFGNSRGEYPVPRTDEWYRPLVRLFEAIDPDRDNSWREYGVEFENEVFSVMPYYWGDCTCGFVEKERAWCEQNQHRETCYQIDYRKIDNKGGKWINYDAWLERYVKPLYIKHGFSIEGEDWWHGCAIRCSCDYQERWEKFTAENSHSKDCPIVKPNFAHKPSGFELQWYKYPLRDSYMNQDISVEQFNQIIDDCIESVKGTKNVG